jgi:glutathione synthase/RimK-type ligase-like ATP-grasp enzyme
LFLFGSGDEADQVVARAPGRGVIRGSSDLGRLFPHRDMIDRMLVTPQQDHVDLSGYPVIVNMITEAEKNAKVLATVRSLLAGVPSRVINPPDAVLRTTRDQVAALLDGISGLAVPRTVRLTGRREAAAETMRNGGIDGPVIVREVGTHTGISVVLHQSAEEAAAALKDGQDYIATEFRDFASADGVYRKYRMFFIGNRMVLRHMYASDHWNVHSPDRGRFMAPRPEIVAEERALIGKAEPFGPKAQVVFREVRERMPLDFFGLDFGFTQGGDVVLFEANATMSFFPLWRTDDPTFEYLNQCLAPAQKAFTELVGQA